MTVKTSGDSVDSRMDVSLGVCLEADERDFLYYPV